MKKPKNPIVFEVHSGGHIVAILPKGYVLTPKDNKWINHPGTLEIKVESLQTETIMDYQKLFEYMANEHDVTLLEYDMVEIINIVNETLQAENQRLKEELEEIKTIVFDCPVCYPKAISETPAN